MPIETAGNLTFWTPAEMTTNSADMSAAFASVSAAPSTGKKLCVDQIILQAGATALMVIFAEETSGTELLRMACPANSTAVAVFPAGLRVPTAGKKIQAKSSAAGQVNVYTSSHSIT